MFGTLATSRAESPTISDYNSKTYETSDYYQKCVLWQISGSQECYKMELSYYSRQYNVNYFLLDAVIMCESSWNAEAVGDSGKAYGLGQFHKPTWDLFNKKRGSDLDYYNPSHQIEMMAWAFSEGLESHWTCFDLCK